MSDGEPLDRLWGKSAVDERGALAAWLPLVQHLDDSADVAGLLWDHWVAPRVQDLVGTRLGGSYPGREAFVLLAGWHDIGKATPAFQRKVGSLASALEPAGLTFAAGLTADEARLLPHGLAGHVIVRRYLLTRGFTPAEADQWAAIVGGHHGIPATDSDVLQAEQRPALLGDGPWELAQTALLDRVVRRAGVDLEGLRGHSLGTPAAAVLTGLVVVADWLASNAELFPLSPVGRLPVPDETRAASAWRKVDLPPPWQPAGGGLDPATLLDDRFDLPAGASIRPVQEAAVRAARTCELPGVVVVEAPMGEGKTEAALLAAEVLAARTGGSGFMLALPTQATTNAMFDRVVRWLSRLPDSGSTGHAVTLAHGKAGLDPVFRQLRAAGRPGDIGADEAVDGRSGDLRDAARFTAYVHWWMTRKKSPLADVVVGTIDQLLFVGLQARHLVLRHLGVAGKVVVIDEVHSYDAYMNVYLERVLEWLGAYRVPVVLLSATLPPATRAALVEAHRRGAGFGVAAAGSWRTRPRPDREAAAPGPQSMSVPEAVQDVYPAVTFVRDGAVRTEPVPPSARTSHVQVELADDGIDRLGDGLEQALAGGGCALVVRNTVASARATYQALAARLGSDHVTLAHSRFLAIDRAHNDRRLVDQFGPAGDRPRRHVVVATQVVEQSLDVDFDLLVTDLAPIDLVLQRVGRLHRHDRLRPPALTTPRCIVLTPSWRTTPPLLDRGSAAVYAPYTLWCAAALLQETVIRDGVLHLPADIAPLVRRAYDERPPTPSQWQNDVDAAGRELRRTRERQRSDAQVFQVGRPRADGSLTGWLARQIGEADESARGLAQVRDSEDSIEVILLVDDGHGGARLPGWIDDPRHGEPVPTVGEPDRDLARAIASCAVRLPAGRTRGERGDRLVHAIESAYFPETFARDPVLRGQLVLRLHPTPDGGAAGEIGGLRLSYHPTTGLHDETAHPGGTT